MGATNIEWTDFSWNPLRARNLKTGKIGWHCEHVSEGCAHCYAETMNKRLGTGLPFKPGHRGDIEIFLDEKMLTVPLRWKKPKRIFVCSMSDLFADFVPVSMIENMFAIMALCPHHIFQVLTKRPARMHARMPEILRAPLPNVWLGTSVEDQETTDARVPHLLATPAAIRFLSCEPLLGPIDLSEMAKISWTIVGGESGPGARPMHPDWARNLRDQCAAAGVPYFFKQWGEWEPASEDRGHTDNDMSTNGAKWVHNDGFVNGPSWHRDEAAIHETPGPFAMIRVGKKRAGRLLDGIEHNGFPIDFNRRV